MSNNNRFFRVCPRGFANEVTYFRVRPEEVAEVEAYFDGYKDRQFNAGETNASCGWTTSATMPGVAVDWADRSAVGF